MGLAVYNSIILDMNFPPCCFKKLLTPPTYSESALGDEGTNFHSADGILFAASATSVGEVKFCLDDLVTVMPVSSSFLLFMAVILNVC